MTKAKTPAPAKKVGRPSSYTKALDDSLCDHIANGKSATSWCEKPGHPRFSTLARWLQTNPEFQERYARAREAQADFLAEEIIQIANTPMVGKKTKINDKGETEVTEGDMIEHRRLQVDARKWYAGKLRPKVYGDKVQQEHSGELTILGLAERMRAQRSK